MYQVLRIVIPMFLMAGLSASAQIPADNTFLPLQEGNSWVYFLPPSGQQDTLWGGTYEIERAIVINDTTYYEGNFPFSGGLGTIFRSDESGSVWSRVNGRDQLLFDFHAEGEPYTFRTQNPGGDTRANYTVTVESVECPPVGAGVFDVCVRIGMDDPAIVDEEIGYTFAAGVGIIKATGGGGSYEELFSAVVDGVVITTTESELPLAPEAASIEVYPNPFRTATTISYLSDAPGAARISIFDVAGRKVDAFQETFVGSSRKRIEWRPDGLAPGVYFIRVETHRTRATTSVMLLR